MFKESVSRLVVAALLKHTLKQVTKKYKNNHKI